MLKLNFVRGHCGWDAVTLLVADEIPETLHRATALRVIDPPVCGGIEVGLLAPGERPGDIRLRVLDSTARDWISMCGGMTQVIGKALVETSLFERFPTNASDGVYRARLITDSGAVPISIAAEGGLVTSVTTCMDAYAAHLYSLGVHPVTLNGVKALDVGEFLVINLDDLRAADPAVDFTRRDEGPHLDIVNAILRAWLEHRPGQRGANAMLYDDQGEFGGQFRVYPRFLGGDGTAARVPFEFQCGTGTVAVAIALAYRDVLSSVGNRGTFVFEWGNPRVTPDPFGVRTSDVSFELRDGRVERVSFSHSVIEIVAQGVLWLPAR